MLIFLPGARGFPPIVPDATVPSPSAGKGGLSRSGLLPPQEHTSGPPPPPPPLCGALQAAGLALKGTSAHAGPLSSRDMPGHTGSVFTRLTHAHTWTRSAAPKLVPLHPEDLGASETHACGVPVHTRVPRPGAVRVCHRPQAPPWPLTPQGADSARGPSPALSAETLSRPHKGDGPWPGGGGAGPVGTDLPGPGGRAGTERGPCRAAIPGLQQWG